MDAHILRQIEKLSLDSQLKSIKLKANYIATKLYPALANSSLEYRYNMWQTFIAPFFDFLLPLIAAEPYAAPIERAETMHRQILRRFTFLHRNVSVATFDHLFNYRLRHRATMLEYISRQKWNARLQGRHCLPD